MDESASRTKMDSIFIAAVNPLSPFVCASFQSFSHTRTHAYSMYKLSLSLSLRSLSLNRAKEYFHSRHHLENSVLMELVHLQFVTAH